MTSFRLRVAADIELCFYIFSGVRIFTETDEGLYLQWFKRETLRWHMTPQQYLVWLKEFFGVEASAKYGTREPDVISFEDKKLLITFNQNRPGPDTMLLLDLHKFVQTADGNIVSYFPRGDINYSEEDVRVSEMMEQG